MSVRVTSVLSAVIVLVGMAALLVACGSSAEVPPQTSQGLVDIRDQLISSKAQVQRTTNAARDLVQRPLAEIKPQIDRLDREYQSLLTMAGTSREQYTATRGESARYWAEWDAQLRTMSDSVREGGEERRAESMRSFQTLESLVADLRGAFVPYMEALSESTRYLNTDPTAEGVRTVAPRIQEAIEAEKTLMARADAVIAQIDKMRGSR